MTVHQPSVFVLQGQPGDSAEIIALRSQAEAAVKAADLGIADALLAEIDDKQAQFQSDLAANRATTLARRGDVALTRLRYAEAAKHFAEAARTLPPGVEYSAKQRDYLTREASALYRQGDEFGDNAALLAAIERRQLLLKMVPRAALPLDLAKTQNHFGNALAVLGERKSGAPLEEAVVAYRAALQELTRARMPLRWARTQNNLGIALQTLGRRESGTGRLEEALGAFRAAL